MAKVEIKIGYVAEWSDKSARVLVLKTKDEQITFPVIIAENEAFSLVKELEKVTLKRPQTHDLLFSIMNSFNLKVRYAHIYNLVEGIFIHVSIAQTMCRKLMLNQEYPMQLFNIKIQLSSIYRRFYFRASRISYKTRGRRHRKGR